MKRAVLVFLICFFVLSHTFASVYIVDSGSIPPITISRSVSSKDISSKTLVSRVPSYRWYHGCAATTIGMLVGYWDNLGIDLIDGSAYTQTEKVNNVIASQQHYLDYAIPIDYRYKNESPLADKSETDRNNLHQNDSIADYIGTSRSIDRLYYGSTIYHTIGNDVENFVSKYGYTVKTKTYRQKELSWKEYKNEIDNHRPVALFVSTYNWPNHLVVGVGYSESKNKKYGAYTTWSNDIRWFDWSIADMDNPWSVWSMITFEMPTRLYFPLFVMRGNR